jgi:hypothetical protein
MSEKTEEQVVEQPNYLEMSDEDILKAGPPVIAPVEEVVETKAEEAKSTSEVKVVEEVVEKKVDEVEAAGDSKAAKTEEVEKVEEVKEAGEKTPADETTETTVETKERTEPEKKGEVDYKAEYERLTAPFKANGKEVKVDSVDDAIALMQMGANYTKKMSALKPNLKLLKTLENHGLLSEEKIGFLVDLSRKDPAAITKLVKDSGLDPMDLDTGKADAYKQKTYAVDDNEIELDTVLDELQGSPTYTRTLDVVSNKWDAASKQVISKSPQLLKVINDHVASGIYDLISAEVEREQMLGRLSGLSNIEAYRKVGDAIDARGGFAHLVKAPASKTTANAPKPPEVIAAKPKAEEDDKLNEKRRAASSTKPAAQVAPPVNYNPLLMSDEEFAKLPAPKTR